MEYSILIFLSITQLLLLAYGLFVILPAMISGFEEKLSLTETLIGQRLNNALLAQAIQESSKTNYASGIENFDPDESYGCASTSKRGDDVG